MLVEMRNSQAQPPRRGPDPPEEPEQEPEQRSGPLFMHHRQLGDQLPMVEAASEPNACAPSRGTLRAFVVRWVGEGRSAAVAGEPRSSAAPDVLDSRESTGILDMSNIMNPDSASSLVRTVRDGGFERLAKIGCN